MQELIYILQKNPRNVKRAARQARRVPVPGACAEGVNTVGMIAAPRGTKKQPVSAVEGRGERLA